MKKNTHTGFLVGNDARTPDGAKKKVDLRETSKFWSADGTFYRKSDGRMAGSSIFPLYQLDLESITPKDPV